MNYQQAVEHLRAQPEMAQAVLDSYLDADNQIAATRFGQSEEFAQVANWLELRAAKRTILDVGCGNGIASYAMAKLGHRVTALDPDLSADVGLRAAQRLQLSLDESAGGEIRCVCGFVESLPFENASFDAVYTRQAVHHFADVEAGLRECRRVLKPNGIFLATREHVVSDEAQRQQFLREHLLHHLHGGENAYPLDFYLKALQSAGFRRTRNLGPFSSVVNYAPLSNAHMREKTAQFLRAKLKIAGAQHLVNLPGVMNLSRRLATKNADHAGRLHSFLCRI